jgi:hypothetical protein
MEKMMRKMIAILATALLASSLLTAQAEAHGRGFGGFGGGDVGGFGGGAQIGGMAGIGRDSGMGRFATDRIGGGDHRFIDRSHPHLESYPRYLPNGSCMDLWYTIPGYRGPDDCS